MKNSGIIPSGIAMFAMMFGAGNVIFPLALGRDVGSNIFYALIGFCITAVLVPLLGIVAMSLYHGDYKKFLGTMGVIPGAFIALICMVLIGPFGCIPRCVTISHAAIHWYFPQVSLLIFSIVASGLIFAATIYQNAVVSVLGRYLGPLKFSLLFSIVVIGLLSGSFSPDHITLPLKAFAKGLLEGYGTMDLLASIFFAGLICASLRQGLDVEKQPSELIIRCIKSGLIGASLLSIVYIGFCLIAAMNASLLAGLDQAQLLSAISSIVLGRYGGVLANITVALSCLTTAIALAVVFANYVHSELSFGLVSYRLALFMTVAVTCVMTNFGFSGIMAIVSPIIVICYPALIILSLATIAHKIFKFPYIKTPVFITLAVFLLLQWW